MLSLRSDLDAGFVGKYCSPENSRTQSYTELCMTNEKVMPLRNDGLSHVYLWNALLAIALLDDQCEEVHKPAYKLCLQSIHAVEVAKLWNASTYHDIDVQSRSKSGFHLQLYLSFYLSYFTQSYFIIPISQCIIILYLTYGQIDLVYAYLHEFVLKIRDLLDLILDFLALDKRLLKLTY